MAMVASIQNRSVFATIPVAFPHIRDISNLYQNDIVRRGREQALWVLVSFLVTFLIVRIITHAIRAGRGPFQNLSVGGTHIHHLVPGIILLILAGYLSNAFHLQDFRTVVAFIFGIGAALTLDEFALWLNLEDVYWEEKGRRSVDAVILAASIAGVVALGFSFFFDLIRLSLKSPIGYR